MNFEIKKANESNGFAIDEINWEVQQFHAKARPDQHTQVRVTTEEVYGTNIFEDDDYGIFVAETTEGKIVGQLISKLVTVKPQFAGQQECKYLYLHSIGVLEAYQHHNIGEALIAESITFAKSLGATSFELGVWEFNQQGIDFYQKLGFKTKTRRMEMLL